MRLFWILGLWWAAPVCAQVFNPGAGVMFAQDVVPRIDILIHPDSLAALYHPANWFSNHEYPCTAVYTSPAVHDTIYNVGLRFRGNTARTKIKKSFRLSYNTFVPGRRYNGLKTMNLNAEVNDPSMLRSHTTWAMYRQHGVGASRSSHVEVYINGEYYGLYQNCEHVNDDFAQTRFGDGKGNLYKCSYPAHLQYVGNNPDDYKTAPWGTRTYELKTNEEVDDYSDLARFIAFLNLSANDEFACRIWEYIDIHSYLKTLAVDVLSGNWDGYAHNMNNYYLYYDMRQDRFHYIPFDLDNTWGIDWLGVNWATRNVHQWAPQGQSRPLYDRVMTTPALRSIFNWHLRQMVQQYLQPASWSQGLHERQALIAPYALADPYRPLDWEHSTDDFLNALTAAAGGHVAAGLIPFAQQRGTTALTQAPPAAIAPVIWQVTEGLENYPEALRITVRTDGPAVAQLALTYALNGSNEPPQQVLPSGNVHTFQVPLQGQQTLQYQVTATGATGLERQAWCATRTIGQGGATVVINEVMASNTATITDPNGEYDDWMELYNYGTLPVSLGGLYLTDKPNAPRYYALPDVTLAPGAHLLVWADDQREQGGLHAPFNLSASGEKLFLVQPTTDGFNVVDHVQVPTLTADVSWGRSSDGASTWQSFANPTPGMPNGPTRTNHAQSGAELLPHPNPTTGAVVLPMHAPWQLCVLDGRALLSGNGNTGDLSSLPAGVYMVRQGERVFRIVKNPF